jgi:hypothetical protein
MSDSKATQQLAFCTHRRGQLTKSLHEFRNYFNGLIEELSEKRQVNETGGEMTKLDKMMFDNTYRKLLSLIDLNVDEFKACVEFEKTANAWLITSLMKVNEEGGEEVKELTLDNKRTTIDKYTAYGKKAEEDNKTTRHQLEEMVKYRDMIPLLDAKIGPLNKEVLAMKVRAGRGSGKPGQRSSPKKR